MKAVLYTPLPWLAGDLCDVLRLFWPVEGYAVAATAPQTPAQAAKAQFTATPITPDMEPLTHTFDTVGGQWRCVFTFRGQRVSRTMPLPHAFAAASPSAGDNAGSDAPSACAGKAAGERSPAYTGDTQGAADVAAMPSGVSTAHSTAIPTPESIAYTIAAPSPESTTPAAATPTPESTAYTIAAPTPESATPAAATPSRESTAYTIATPSRESATPAAAAPSPESTANPDGDTATPDPTQSIGNAPLPTTQEYAASGDAVANSALLERRLQKRLCKLTLYELAKQLTGARLPWGSLTGIRPTRLVYEGLADGLPLDAAAASLTTLFDVAPEKAALLRRIVAVQQTLPAPSPAEADVYISIPFCRTRCAYCSFPGEALGAPQHTAAYLEALYQEMRQTAALMRAQGLTLRALYIGGGTPTALAEADFETLLAETAACFPHPFEFTVEAGRPDTITSGKLAAMLRQRVTRVSINPQTMNDDTLRRIGRDHTAAQTVETYQLARAMGFANINMDVIAGLPGETAADFARTMEGIQALMPDSLTVHTLAIKRASRLHQQAHTPAAAQEVTRMVWLGEQAATRMGMAPYYLYRQKYMAGQQQNVGYAKPGAACLYNVDIMEEVNTVLACGAGAISKRVLQAQGLRITRAPNVTNVSVYTQRVADMMARKAALFQ